MAYSQRQRCRGEPVVAEDGAPRFSVERVLQNVCTDIALSAVTTKRTYQEIKALIEEHLIVGLKADAVFAHLYQEIYMGCLYEGIKLHSTATDEMDLALVLALPVPPSHLQLSTAGMAAGCMRMMKFAQALEMHAEMQKDENQHVKLRILKWCDNEGSLLQTEFRKWFVQLVHDYAKKHRASLKKLFKKKHFDVHLSVDGATIRLKLDDVNVELVPVLEFKPPLQPPRCFRPLLNLVRQ